MGSALSTKSLKLIKPEDCSVEVWKKILQLFDKLDADGTHSIEDAELMGHIATLHVDNNIRELENNKREISTNMEFEKEKIQSDLERNIKKLQKNAEENIKNITTSQEKQIQSINSSIENLNKMQPEERAKKIHNAICGNKESIEFWDLYKYMKNRTNDIPNIIW
jgi:phosphoenolpyruvate carboxylase